MTSDDTGMGELTNRAQELARGIHATYQKLCDTAADRNEWRTQHENLLAIYRSQTEQVAALIEQRDQLIEDQAWQLLHIAGLSGCLRDFVEASQDDGRYPTLVRRGQEKLDVKHPSRITRKRSVTRKGNAK